VVQAKVRDLSLHLFPREVPPIPKDQTFSTLEKRVFKSTCRHYLKETATVSAVHQITLVGRRRLFPGVVSPPFP